MAALHHPAHIRLVMVIGKLSPIVPFAGVVRTRGAEVDENQPAVLCTTTLDGCGSA